MGNYFYFLNFLADHLTLIITLVDLCILQSVSTRIRRERLDSSWLMDQTQRHDRLPSVSKWMQQIKLKVNELGPD